MAHVIDAVLQLKDQFSGQLKNISNGLSDFQKQSKYIASDMKKVGKATESIGKDLITHGTVPLLGVGIAATKASNDLTDGMAKVSTIADTTKVSLDTLSKSVIDLSNETGLKVTELAEAEYQALSASVDTGKVTEFLGVAAKSAKGGFTDTATAVEGLTNVLNAYDYEADKANDIANQMLITQNLGKTTFGELARSMGKVTPISSSLGIKTEELFSSLAVTTAQGLDTAESVTALKAAMSNIIKPSKEASDAAEQLGIDFSVSALKSKGWIGFLKDVKKGLEQASPELKKTFEQYKDLYSKLNTLEKSGGNKKEIALTKKQLKNLKKELESLSKMSDSPISAMAQMFGSVEGLNSILMLTSDQGLKKYNESIKEMGTNTTAVQDAYDKMQTPAEKFRQSLNRAHNSLLGIGGALTPTMESLGNVIDKITDKISKLTPEQQKMIVKFGLIAAGVGPAIFIIGKITKSISNTITNINKLSSSIKKAGGILAWLSSPGHAVVLVLAAIITIAALLIIHWKDICKFTKEVKEKLIKLKDDALDKLKKAFEEVKKKVEKFKDAIKEAEPVIKKVAGVLGTIFGPALVKTGTKAVIAGAKIAGHFVASIIKTGVQAVINGAKLTANFIAAVVKTGVTGVVAGAKLTASFIAAIIKTGIQAAKTAAIITGKLIIAIVQYALAGWRTVGAITAQTVAWLFQKGVVAGHTIVLIAHKVASLALTGVTKGLTIAQWALNAAFVATPVGWIILAIGAIIGIAILLYKAWTKNWGGIQEKTQAVVDYVKEKIDSIKETFNSVKEKCVEFAQSIKETWDGIKEWLKHPIQGTVSLIKNGDLSGIKGKNALGTPYWGGGLSIVGEHGPEVVELPQSSKVHDNKDSRRMVGKSGNITITFGDVHVRQESDIDAIANAIVKKLEIQRLNMA